MMIRTSHKLLLAGALLASTALSAIAGEAQDQIATPSPTITSTGAHGDELFAVDHIHGR